MYKVNEVMIKKSLQKSKISEYCINPYLGCLNGCSYCYASFIMQRWYHKDEVWGEFVDIRINSVENIKKEIKNRNYIDVYISSMTDPYQIVEEKYKMTRGILKTFLESENSLFDKKFKITIQTKNDLILRDLDILKELKDITCGFTITIIDEKMQKIFERGASNTFDRLKSLEILNKNNIKTYAFFGPILPGISDDEGVIYKLIKLIYDTGTREILFDKLSYFKYIERLKNLTKKFNLFEKFMKSEDEKYLLELKIKILSILKDFKNIDYKIFF